MEFMKYSIELDKKSKLLHYEEAFGGRAGARERDARPPGRDGVLREGR